jgi:hypothetical protein
MVTYRLKTQLTVRVKLNETLPAGSYREMSSILVDQYSNSALVYEPKWGGGGGWVAGSQLMSTAVNTRPNKLWRSNSIF